MRLLPVFIYFVALAAWAFPSESDWFHRSGRMYIERDYQRHEGRQWAGSVWFRNRSSEVASDSGFYNALRHLEARMESLRIRGFDARIVVIGFADPVRENREDIALGLSRAQNVATMLDYHGVDMSGARVAGNADLGQGYGQNPFPPGYADYPYELPVQGYRPAQSGSKPVKSGKKDSHGDFRWQRADIYLEIRESGWPLWAIILVSFAGLAVVVLSMMLWRASRSKSF